MRKTIFSNNEIYHVFNLGIEKRPTFTDKREFDRALLTLNYYRYSNTSIGLAQVLNLESEKRNFFLSQLSQKDDKLVEILAFCLMPNHFHLLLKQLKDKGIKTFLSNFTNSYTRYFNTRRKRIGPLFQGIFKAARIEDDDRLIHVFRYININPVTSLIICESNLESYSYTSFPEYLGEKNYLCNKKAILDYFPSIDKLKDFVYDQVDYGKKLEAIKHLVFE